MTRYCPRCHSQRVLSMFRADPTRLDGLRSQCVICENEIERRIPTGHRVIRGRAVPRGDADVSGCPQFSREEKARWDANLAALIGRVRGRGGGRAA